MTNAEKKMLAREKPDVLAHMVDSKHCKGCIYYKKSMPRAMDRRDAAITPSPPGNLESGTRRIAR